MGISRYTPEEMGIIVEGHRAGLNVFAIVDRLNTLASNSTQRRTPIGVNKQMIGIGLIQLAIRKPNPYQRRGYAVPKDRNPDARACDAKFRAAMHGALLAR